MEVGQGSNWGCNTKEKKNVPTIEFKVLSHVWVTKDGVRIGNLIYWILTGRGYK
jgi:hypothetical protein